MFNFVIAVFFLSCEKLLVKIYMRLNASWEKKFKQYMDIEKFYSDLSVFVKNYDELLPSKENIFRIFDEIDFDNINLVIYGEDPYPRKSSANGIAFWDKEIKEWENLSRGNSLKHILKALMIHKKLANHDTTIAECREISKNRLIAPGNLFRDWLKNGTFLINSALSFSGKEAKKQHFKFWREFQKSLIKILSERRDDIFYLLWGKVANNWKSDLLENGIPESKIISQMHPTFQHQFLYRDGNKFSPFTEIIEKTNLDFLAEIERK